jgi:D-alanyl-D-alanine carboxypeptidase/D-alanyl-D-alanine-endopeptidase (penicillin-binding protein 4)
MQMKIVFTSLILLFFYNHSNAQLDLPDIGASVCAKAHFFELNKDLFTQDEELLLIPASLTKVITTATALELLGPDYQFETKFYYTGNIINHKLIGNLIVESSGDPTLGSIYFEQTDPDSLFCCIKEVLIDFGITSVEGNVIIAADKISYPAPRLWEDMGNYYGGSPKGFNWRDNTINITLQSGEIGTECSVLSTEPDFDSYQLDCRVMAANHNNDSAYVFGISEINQWWIEGSIPAWRSSFNIKAAMPDPKVVFKKSLKAYLKKHGISFKYRTAVKQTSSSARRLLFTHCSPSLAEIIKVTNHKSNNLFADQLLLALAKEKGGKVNWDNGNAVVYEFWHDKIDFDTEFRLKDGSGLSPKNLVSAKGMVQLLVWMKENSHDFETFALSLAKGGESGTLKYVFKHPDLKGRIIGKSGSMEGVLGYCGYLKTSSGKNAAFCMIANNYLVPTKQIRSAMDKMITEQVLHN